MTKNPVIYKITSPSGKVYIGQSWNVEKRFKSYACYECSKQRKLHASIQKHGWMNHKVEIILELEQDISQDLLDYIENAFIEFYKNRGYEMLNLRGGGARGKASEETKKLQSIGLKKSFENGRVSLIGGDNPKAVSVIQLTKTGDIIKEWSSMSEPRKLFNAKNILRCCCNIGLSSGGYCWIYKKDIDKIPTIEWPGYENPLKGKKRPDMSLRLRGEGNHNYGKPLNIEVKKKLSIALTGRVISQETIEKRRINHSGSKNWKARAVLQYDLQGNFIREWSYISESEKELGFANSNIVKCCKGIKKQAYGFIWKYKNIK